MLSALSVFVDLPLASGVGRDVHSLGFGANVELHEHRNHRLHRCRTYGCYLGHEDDDSASRGRRHQQHLSDRICAASRHHTDVDPA